MKFEKPQAAIGSGLTSEQIEAANRFSERRAREEDERRSEYVNPEMRRRIAELFKELGHSLAMPNSRQRSPSWRQMTQVTAAENLAELESKYADAPIVMTEELRLKVVMPDEEGEF
jgi:hypothetical protein